MPSECVYITDSIRLSSLVTYWSYLVAVRTLWSCLVLSVVCASGWWSWLSRQRSTPAFTATDQSQFSHTYNSSILKFTRDYWTHSDYDEEAEAFSFPSDPSSGVWQSYGTNTNYRLVCSLKILTYFLPLLLPSFISLSFPPSLPPSPLSPPFPPSLPPVLPHSVAPTIETGASREVPILLRLVRKSLMTQHTHTHSSLFSCVWEARKRSIPTHIDNHIHFLHHCNIIMYNSTLALDSPYIQECLQLYE